MGKQAIRFIILMGLVSLLADITYEGARSITGPWLAILGAGGAAVGVIVGLGELIGYGIRVASGYAADRLRSYWLFAFSGYAINLLAVPMLALAENWQMAAFLIVLERLGKGIRTPARDAMLSFATKQVGRGFGFGLHEAMDQIGAIAGPLAVAGVLFFQHQYAVAFACLAVPALSALSVLVFAKSSSPHPEKMEPTERTSPQEKFPRQFWIFVLGASLVGAGFVDFALLAFHFQKSQLVSPAWIPLLYALAMGVDGCAAFWMGKLFDWKGVSVLTVAIIIASLFAPLVFLGGFWAIASGMILWGIGMGAQESIMRSHVAVLIPPHRRAAAYGILYLCFGIFWFLGSSTIGLLYDISLTGTVLFSMAAQILGAFFFWRS